MLFNDIVLKCGLETRSTLAYRVWFMRTINLRDARPAELKESGTTPRMCTLELNKLVGSRKNCRGLKKEEESELVTSRVYIYRDCRTIVVPRRENSEGGKERGKTGREGVKSV